MTPTISTRSRAARITSRVSVMAAVLMVTLFGAASVAHAGTGLTYRGDFSWKSTEMNRLAVCAYVDGWLLHDETGSQLTRCDGAAHDSKYDSLSGWAESLTANNGVLIEVKQIGYQGGACPSMLGFRYVKCYYLGGKGSPVMTISESQNANFAGGMALVSWYYL